MLVHSGDPHGGHYSALLKTEKDGRWMRFDDDRVTLATTREAMEENYGGEFSGPNSTPNMRPQVRGFKRFTNAYMLVYIRKSEIDEVLGEVNDIPDHLSTYVYIFLFEFFLFFLGGRGLRNTSMASEYRKASRRGEGGSGAAKTGA